MDTIPDAPLIAGMIQSSDSERDKLMRALERAGLTPSRASLLIGRDKGFLGDYFRGKTSSLKTADKAKLDELIEKHTQSTTRPPKPSRTDLVSAAAVREVLHVLAWHYLMASGMPEGQHVQEIAAHVAEMLLETIQAPPSGTVGVDHNAALRLQSDAIIRRSSHEPQ